MSKIHSGRDLPSGQAAKRRLDESLPKTCFGKRQCAIITRFNADTRGSCLPSATSVKGRIASGIAIARIAGKFFCLKRRRSINNALVRQRDQTRAGSSLTRAPPWLLPTQNVDVVVL